MASLDPVYKELAAKLNMENYETMQKILAKLATPEQAKVILELPKPSGDLRTDYKKRAEMACELAEVYDVIYIHIKGPDEPAHDGDCEAKKKAIELIDAHFFKNLRVDLENVAVAVTADHSTPCTLRSHSDDPVPFMVSGCGIKGDGMQVFGERECSKGSLGVMNGQELLRRIFSLL
jgi:2,3-bisphosphoglycerate-independent phosphoglycerate mutase